MIITVYREGRGTKARVWQFTVDLMAYDMLGPIKFQLVRYSVLRRDGEGNQKIVSQWSAGWDSNMKWSEVFVPQDVMEEVKKRLCSAAEYGEFWQGATRLGSRQITYLEQRLNEPGDEDEQGSTSD